MPSTLATSGIAGWSSSTAPLSGIRPDFARWALFRSSYKAGSSPGVHYRYVDTQFSPVALASDKVSLQAFLLTTDTQGRNLLSPLVANCLFVVLGSALLLGSIAAASVNVVAGNRLWSEFAVIITKMKDYESTWTEGTSTLPQLLTLKANLDRVTALSERSRV